MTRRFNFWLALVLLAVAVPYWWLLLDNRHDGIAPQPLHIARLRALAMAQPGPLPTALEVEVVARRHVMGTVMAAGIGIKWRTLGVAVYRLPVPGRGAVVINAGMTARQAGKLAFRTYNPVAQQRVDRALREAGLILATNESAEHLGGLSALARMPGGERVLDHAALRPQQWLTDPRQDLAWPAAKHSTGPADPRPYAVAPGVVVIPASGHSPGSQMVFVRLADGRELLFASDVSALAVNWQQVRARSRLLGQWHNHQDREAVYSWLLTIGQLHAEAPELVVVPGHDADWLEAMVRQGIIKAGFGR